MKRILITDDSAMSRIFIRRCMEIVMSEDAEFLEATNGKEALEMMKERPVDILLLDLNMPVMDGTELLRRISSSPKLFGTPVVVISSLKNPTRNQELLDLGAKAVLGKPVTPPLLAEALKEILKGEKIS